MGNIRAFPHGSRPRPHRLRLAARDKYQPGKILMIGDAPGDQKAAAVADTLNKQINAVLQAPDVKERLAHEGAEAAPMTRAAFAQLIRSDHDKWGKVIAATGIKGD